MFSTGDSGGGGGDAGWDEGDKGGGDFEANLAPISLDIFTSSYAKFGIIG